MRPKQEPTPLERRLARSQRNPTQRNEWNQGEQRSDPKATPRHECHENDGPKPRFWQPPNT